MFIIFLKELASDRTLGKFKLIFYKLFSDEQLKKKGLSERQLKAMNFLREQKSITNSEYQEVTGVSKRTATRELNLLVDMNILVSEGGSRGRGKVYYFSTP